MQRDTLLTQDELDFIQNMQHNPQLNLRDPSSSLTVNGGAQLRDLPLTTTSLSRRNSITSNSPFPCTWWKMSFMRCICAWAYPAFSKTGR